MPSLFKRVISPDKAAPKLKLICPLLGLGDKLNASTAPLELVVAVVWFSCPSPLHSSVPISETKFKEVGILGKQVTAFCVASNSLNVLGKMGKA